MQTLMITLNLAYLVTSEKTNNIVAAWQADLLCEHVHRQVVFSSCGVNT